MSEIGLSLQFAMRTVTPVIGGINRLESDIVIDR
jgi:hypothetical protein